MSDIEPIGLIHSPFTTIEDMPIQPKGAAETAGHISIFDEYVGGLQDLDGFSHIYLLYFFHKATRTRMHVIPFMDEQPRGVFATRSTLRPNHIGLSIVNLTRVEGNRIFVKGIDILDGSPLLDIKPYIHQFDAVQKSVSGWMKSNDLEVRQTRSDERFR